MIGTYTDLVNYLSKESNLPKYEKVPVSPEDSKEFYFEANGYEYKAKLDPNRKGVILIIQFQFRSPLAFMKSISIDYPIDKIYVKKYRSLDDFGIPYKLIGNIVEVNNKRFLYV